MSNRKIIIPEGMVEHPEEKNIIEIPNKLKETKGDLIVKRRGGKLVAQQLPEWHDSLATDQNSTFLSAVSSSFDDTFYTALGDTTYYSQNAESSTKESESSYLNTPSPPLPNQTFAAPPASRTFAGAPPINQTCARNNYSNRTPVSKSQTLEEASKRRGRPRPGYDTFPRSFNRSLFEDESPLTSPRDLATDESYDMRFQPWHASTMRSLSNLENSSFEIDMYTDTSVNLGQYNVIRPMTSSPVSKAVRALPTNQTFAQPLNQTRAVPSGAARSSPPAARGASQTVSQYSRKTARSRPGYDTFPRSADRSLLEAESIGCSCSPPRLSPTDESYEQRFQTQQLNETRGAVPSGATFVGTAANETCPRSFSPAARGASQTFPQYSRKTAPSRPGYDTFSRSADRSLLDAESARCDCSSPRVSPAHESYDERFQTQQLNQTRNVVPSGANFVGTAANETCPRSFSPAARGASQTFPQYARKTAPSRPGYDTFSGSANRSLLDAESGGCICSPPRVSPTHGSYDERFQTRQLNQTRNVVPAGTTFVGRAANETCPGTFSSAGDGTSQSFPRPSRKTARSRPGYETFPRSADRSMIETVSPSGSPYMSSRDLATDESYELRFHPWQASSMKGLSDLEDSSLEINMITKASICPGQYNVIKQMSPSPSRRAAAGQTFAANQTMPKPGSANQTFPQNRENAGSPQTLPRARPRNAHSRAGYETFPRSAAAGGKCNCSPNSSGFGSFMPEQSYPQMSSSRDEIECACAPDR